MEFSYRISPFTYAKYILYTFRFILLLLPALLCPAAPPVDGAGPVLGLLAGYAVLALSFWALATLVLVPFSLVFTLWQRQAGAVSTVRLDDTGLTERWRDRQVHIPWTGVRRVILRRRFLQLKAAEGQWFLFRGCVDRETFLALSRYIRSHTAAR